MAIRLLIKFKTVFGSAARNEDTEDSDIDFLILALSS